ncbi:peptidase M48 Ste24p [Oscillochloris trichoides DG-6]|uniref:Protease HtpX homolog n=1 Tax=Oscillochloris trichoides DG-6 TaxID=765420 RepID=E1IGM9_9CHLR|nr:zinc metalloprotease HtpX [Oscillochloris trichoides]EFO79664.1 peptidase M48 Ste24p [Oscillochloris trichoides DG-6]
MQIWNTFKTTILLAGLTALFMVIGGAIGGQVGMIIALVMAVAMNMGAWWFSDSLALRMSGAHEVSPAEAPELHQMVEELSIRAEIPKPRVYLIESETPNAFATGRSPAKGAVAVTTGIARLLTRDELAGVVAHELAHIKHRDTLISSIAATIAGAISMLADMAMWSLMFAGLGGSDDGEDEGIAGMVGGVLMMILAPIAAMIIQMAISRSREYLADAGGARILGDPLPLASALEKLEWAAGRVPMQASPATSHLYIINPLVGGLAGLFRTHPATAERIARLRAMSGQNVAMA